MIGKGETQCLFPCHWWYHQYACNISSVGGTNGASSSSVLDFDADFGTDFDVEFNADFAVEFNTDFDVDFDFDLDIDLDLDIDGDISSSAF